MFGYTGEEWQRYIADLRASYSEDFTEEERREWAEHLAGTGEAALHARVAWFRKRRRDRHTE